MMITNCAQYLCAGDIVNASNAATVVPQHIYVPIQFFDMNRHFYFFLVSEREK